MKYVLFGIFINYNGHYTINLGEYETLQQCFKKRDYVISVMKRPKINYQTVCLIKDFRNV
jgi:hypothetical protein